MKTYHPRYAFALMLLAGIFPVKEHQAFAQDRFGYMATVQGLVASDEVGPYQQKQVETIFCASTGIQLRGMPVGVGASYWLLDGYWANTQAAVPTHEPVLRFPAATVYWHSTFSNRLIFMVQADIAPIRKEGATYLTLIPRLGMAYRLTPHLGISFGCMSLVGTSVQGEVITTGLPYLFGVQYQYRRPYGNHLKLKKIRPCHP